MNSTEQALRKQVIRKENQLRTLIRTLEHTLKEIEELSSIGCAFAWDVGARNLDAQGAEKLWHDSLQEALDSEAK